eukprot:CAMPEP_0119465946 /NCGR_PEP_ID=MMETSP1344-20130328/835_1 /TAXON_ID=236787 /ORGANISM="Florenciella parvula, Strain CCMP2471" /LENGTH=223 /DNA_ID=CAMNT_0007498233 /DNA_START=162 /DNA_END=831 /DNA_ORIENTATION=+
MSVTLHTSLGEIKIEIACDIVPKAAFNFLALCAAGQYNGTTFHRNMKSFMVQGGDPTGTGKGGDSIWGGTFDDEFSGELRHDRRGVVSMANKGANTNRAQFFITYGKQPHLNNKYTVIGRVIDGFEALDAMEKVPTGKKDRPLSEIKINQVQIHANPLAEEGSFTLAQTAARREPSSAPDVQSLFLVAAADCVLPLHAKCQAPTARTEHAKTARGASACACVW